MIQIARTHLNFEREPMAAPWGFKGGFLTEIWQVVALLESAGGKRGIGLGVPSVLWCDPQAFVRFSEAAGNSAMLLMSAHALRLAAETGFTHPMELLDRLLMPVWEYGKAITGLPDLRLTFALNALVPVDNAAWLLYAAENGLTTFDDLIPEAVRPTMAHRQAGIISVPAVGYGLAVSEVVKLAQAGYFLFKIKVGSDPERDGDLDKMLAWDIARMEALHTALKDLPSPASPTGHALYYLDANGRYDSKARLLKLLDTLDGLGVLERTLLLEEPFPETVLESVADIPLRVVADESAHTDRDVETRAHLGYGAVALKPIAKTLSMSFRMRQTAHARQMPCFCADLTVNPLLVDWNKSFAARLEPLPGMDLGLMETNGFQNYRDWSQMGSYHAVPHADWMQAVQGVFPLTESFYQQSGGIFLPSPHYNALVSA